MVAIEVVIAVIVGTFLTVVSAVMLYFAYGLREQTTLLGSRTLDRETESPEDADSA